jgi:hypothetical protein
MKPGAPYDDQACKSTKATQIEIQLRDQEQNIGELAENIAYLSKALTRVLRDVPEEPDQITRSEATQVPLATDLYIINCKIRRCSAEILALLDRLEL